MYWKNDKASIRKWIMNAFKPNQLKIEYEFFWE